jgi:hypothetical protein
MDLEPGTNPVTHPASPVPNPVLTRRSALLNTAALATALGTLELVGQFGRPLQRVAAADTVQPNAATLPDIQFDIGAFIAPAQTINGIVVQLPPVNTVFLTARLQRTPTRTDQTELDRALNQLETSYPFSASGLITFVAYGRPYFNRLPGGIAGTLVNARMPKLRSDTTRPVLEEAVPSPTDVSSANPGITKVRFNVPVQIEANDLLFTFRSDSQTNIQDAINWFNGSGRLAGRSVTSPRFSGLLTFTSSRAMFTQMGMPRFVAGQFQLPFAQFINPQTPMWMGFADQQVNASGPASICTFVGNNSARFTTAAAGDYFDNGSIQHLSHVVLDMLQFYDMDSATAAPGDDGVFTERVQYMFHSPAINPGNSDQLTDGGGPAFLPNENRGVNYARQTAQGIGTAPDPANPGQNEHRLGHLSTLQRSSRASDGTPIHIRMDGPGFDNMDVPGNSKQPKLQFTSFVPTAEFFRQMRVNQASLDLQNQFDVDEDENGLERFLTTTRRQNFLAPPRRHRSFPLVELT